MFKIVLFILLTYKILTQIILYLPKLYSSKYREPSLLWENLLMSELNFLIRSSSESKLCISTLSGFVDLIILFKCDQTNEPTKTLF